MNHRTKSRCSRLVWLCLSVSGGCARETSSELKTSWIYCDGTTAFAERHGNQYRRRQPDMDYICQTPVDQAGARCRIAEDSVCVDGDARGPHDVPEQGWYIAYGASNESLRCRCGCFAPGTRLLVDDGSERTIEDIAEAATHQDVAFRVRASAERRGAWRASESLRASDFRIGPEDRALVAITARAHRTLLVTDKHPILVLRAGRQAMVPAGELLADDRLVDGVGKSLPIQSLAMRAHPRADRLVYNFSLRERDAVGHIVVAEGLQVGDNVWQNALEALAARVEEREHGSLAYLDELRRDGVTELALNQGGN